MRHFSRASGLVSIALVCSRLALSCLIAAQFSFATTIIAVAAIDSLNASVGDSALCRNLLTLEIQEANVSWGTASGRCGPSTWMLTT